MTTDVLALPEARYQFKARRSAWPFSFSPVHRARDRNHVTERFSKSRQQAEIAFGNVQTQFLAKHKAVEEVQSTDKARDAKTLRLREARLAKEMDDRAARDLRCSSEARQI
ncbi:hypothetical protein J2X43_005792 [Rhizobium sp. BE258]|nr:hypothetical protein [Rhizobium sp. BE258]